MTVAVAVEGSAAAAVGMMAVRRSSIIAKQTKRRRKSSTSPRSAPYLSLRHLQVAPHPSRLLTRRCILALRRNTVRMRGRSKRRSGLRCWVGRRVMEEALLGEAAATRCARPSHPTALRLNRL